jgi:hypothetical protein
MGGERGAYTIMVVRSEKRDHLEDLGVSGKKNIKMDLQEVGWGIIDCIDLAQDRDSWQALVNAVMNLAFQKCGEFLDYVRTCYLLRKASAS